MMILVCMGCANLFMHEQTITLLAIPGIPAPEAGAPVIRSINTEQYTGTISWSPAENPFTVTTVYTASIVLTPEDGYTLTGVEANNFTLAGASSVTNDTNNGMDVGGNGCYKRQIKRL